MAVERGEATRAELAYLTDRVLLAEGQRQEYGTQIEGGEDGWVPQRLRDPEHVDERRVVMSLGPIADNIRDIERAYGPPKPPELDCGGCGAVIRTWLPDEGEGLTVRCSACSWTVTLAGLTAPDETLE